MVIMTIMPFIENTKLNMHHDTHISISTGAYSLQVILQGGNHLHRVEKSSPCENTHKESLIKDIIRAYKPCAQHDKHRVQAYKSSGHIKHVPTQAYPQLMHFPSPIHAALAQKLNGSPHLSCSKIHRCSLSQTHGGEYKGGQVGVCVRVYARSVYMDSTHQGER